jgi:hypothetical protein
MNKDTAVILFQTKYGYRESATWSRSKTEGTHLKDCTTGLLFLVASSETLPPEMSRLSYATVTDLPDLLNADFQEYARGLDIDIKYDQLCIV